MNLSITAPRGLRMLSQSAYHSRSMEATSSAVSWEEMLVKFFKSPTSKVACTVLTGRLTAVRSICVLPPMISCVLPLSSCSNKSIRVPS